MWIVAQCNLLRINLVAKVDEISSGKGLFKDVNEKKLSKLLSILLTEQASELAKIYSHYWLNAKEIILI